MVLEDLLPIFKDTWVVMLGLLIQQITLVQVVVAQLALAEHLLPAPAMVEQAGLDNWPLTVFIMPVVAAEPLTIVDKPEPGASAVEEVVMGGITQA
jgi:hypothetical protein